MSTDAAWKAFLRPLSTSETAQVIEDLFDAGLALIANNFGPCLAPQYLVLQASPSRVTSAASEQNYSGLGSLGESELVQQVGWAWLAAWSTSESSAGLPSMVAIAESDYPPLLMPPDAWAWCVRALNMVGTPFSSVAEARAAIPS